MGQGWMSLCIQAGGIRWGRDGYESMYQAGGIRWGRDG